MSMNELSDKDIFEKAVTRARGNVIAHGKKDGISDYEIIIELEREIDYYRERTLNFQDVLKRKNIIIAELKEQQERRINDMQNVPAVLISIKEDRGELIFDMTRADEITPTGNVIRISPEAATVIDEIRAETGLPASSVASALIAYAGKHYTVTRS